MGTSHPRAPHEAEEEIPSSPLVQIPSPPLEAVKGSHTTCPISYHSKSEKPHTTYIAGAWRCRRCPRLEMSPVPAPGDVAEAITKTTSTSSWAIGGVAKAITKALGLFASGRPTSSLKRPVERRFGRVSTTLG
ncbi:hypothetical protein U1Q18_002605 [Sarracenia purpurea var. burkii]